ncbi:MAG: EamA/RhaT family transporter [Nanoarchaeota archaeon]|nr:EamA/RhaT family transporter [Nanoarchaeota archaeon]
MERTTKAILLMLVTTLFTSVAQVLYKFGAEQLSFSLSGILFNGFLIGGLALYGIGAAIMIVAFRSADVSLLYPAIATSYVWVSLLSLWIFNETISFMHWIGVMVIVLGVAFVGFGSKTPEVVHGN